MVVWDGDRLRDTSAYVSRSYYPTPRPAPPMGLYRNAGWDNDRVPANYFPRISPKHDPGHLE